MMYDSNPLRVLRLLKNDKNLNITLNKNLTKKLENVL